MIRNDKLTVRLIFLLVWVGMVSCFSSTIQAQTRCAAVVPTSNGLEKWINAKKKKLAALKDPFRTDTLPILQIPVVVHVFHQGEPIGTGRNLSDEVIENQIDILNDDFRRMNKDKENTPEVFQSVAADTEIAFMLAKQDPNGNPSNGIVRINTRKEQFLLDLPHLNETYKLLRSESYWPAQHSINIYSLDLQDTYLGFATFPNTSGVSNSNTMSLLFEGLLIDYTYFGVNPDAPSFSSLGRTLTHEMGHYFGLLHIWGVGGCFSDDLVDDTPLSRKSHNDVNLFCEIEDSTERNTCVDSGVLDPPDMFQNYMDYTRDVCMNLFTHGQKDRMRLFAENAIGRKSLLTSPALTLPNIAEIDLGIVEIVYPKQGICSPANDIVPKINIVNYGMETITEFMIQISVNDTITNTINHVIQINPNEKKLVSMIISNLRVGDTIDFEILTANTQVDQVSENNTYQIIIKQNQPIVLPYQEDFEEQNGFHGSFFSTDPWQYQSLSLMEHTNRVLSYQNTSPFQSHALTNIIKTPILDISGNSFIQIKFKYAYASLYSSNAKKDGLILRASLDCGDSFDSELLFEAFGVDLISYPTSDGSTYPVKPTDWIEQTVDISNVNFTHSEIQFAFYGLGGDGNRIYIDDISVYQINKVANDVRITEYDAPYVTCTSAVELSLNIKNVGASDINSFQIAYGFTENMQIEAFNNQNILLSETKRLYLTVLDLSVGKNTIPINILSVNGVPNPNDAANQINITVYRSDYETNIPIVVNFEHDFTETEWLIPGTSPIWRQTYLSDSNGVMQTNVFDNLSNENESWLISPVLKMSALNSPSLSFDVSYANRIGFFDQLKILFSLDCGKTFPIELFSAYSDSLAVIATNDLWTPSSAEDWKNFNIDISEFAEEDDLRIAFVFVDGNGNNLYLDNIEITNLKADLKEEKLIVYPNPVMKNKVSVGFELDEKQDVVIKLLNVAGKIIAEKKIKDALNQEVKFETPVTNGIYIIWVQGKSYSESKRVIVYR